MNPHHSTHLVRFIISKLQRPVFILMMVFFSMARVFAVSGAANSSPVPWPGAHGGAGAAPLDVTDPNTNGLPIIITDPASQTIDFLHNGTLQVVAAGALPLAYQWLHNGTNIAGATNTSLPLVSVRPVDGGSYRAIVANSFGSVTSAPAIVTIGGLIPQITSAFADTNVLCGDSVTFRVQAIGPSKFLPIYYQWQFNGLPIESATTNFLSLTNVAPNQAGQYTVVVTNLFGLTNTSATLTVTPVPPVITSALSTTATQGQPFSYQIEATHTPASYGALYLPNGLTLDPQTGLISGTPVESGAFGPILSASNFCSIGTATLVLNVASAAPVLTTAASARGTEGVPLSFRIVASGPDLSYYAQNLPPGLSVDSASGRIAGTPLLAGVYATGISASNEWGLAAATVQFTISNAIVTALSIGNVSYHYSSPYVLDFSFSLLDNEDPSIGNGIVADPSLLSATCFEDDVAISASETGAFVARTSTKVIKAYLVLDFTESIASLVNGDNDQNGISDAVDNMVNGAIGLVNQQSIDTQIGVYEFHREDQDPVQVIGLTTDKSQVKNAIAGIWTNYVRDFPAGSRCWDATLAALKGLGKANRDEEHFVILVSDGRDESSTNALITVLSAATNANAQVVAIGFGAELDPVQLQTLAASTQGRYYAAQTPDDIAQQFAQISKLTRGQYILRWATLKRAKAPFMPSFQITYQGLTANSPTNPFTLGDTNIDTTVDPPVTNITPPTTNFIIGYFSTVSNAGPVLAGSLRLVPNAEVQPTGLDLRATYIPRFVRQLRLHYRANWPCTVSLQSTGPGELLSGWGLSQTNDGAGGDWLLLSSPPPGDLTNSLPFAGFGKLLTFAFQDPIDPTNAFSLLEVDNTVYTNTGGQSFAFENDTNYLAFYPSLPHGTPVPWLMSYGISGDFTNAENLDPDGDGMANWQEFRANTDPTNAQSALLVRSVSRQADGRYQVVFDTSTNRTYRLQQSGDLLNWRTAQDSIPGANETVTITDPAYLPGDQGVFYRVQVY